MCGHVGVICKNPGGLFTRDVDMFEDMLYIDALRGDDATGVCMITRQHGAVVLKEASHSAWFTYGKEYNEERGKFVSDGRALLGHNRKATIGGAKDANAHPFVIDDRVVFFHNGTLHSHLHLAQTEVDSEALGQHLAKANGDPEQVAEQLTEVSGAYACVWYDAEKNTIYFLRNAQRPLALIEMDNGDFLYASEAWMATGAAARRNQKVKDVISLDVDTLYSLSLTDDFKLVKEPLPKKVKPSTSQSGQGASITDIKGLSKSKIKTLRKELARSDVHCFWPDDVVGPTENPDPTHVYDWLVLGSNPAYPGVVFQTYLKDKFEHETLHLYNTLAHGRTSFITVGNNTLTVELTNVKFVSTHKQAETCH